MLHKNAVTQDQTNRRNATTSSNNLLLMPQPVEGGRASSSRMLDLLIITSRRCSTFFAEAAVLVLVFGILDYFMLKGRIELPWIVGALGISVGLMIASIAMDFSAHRWMRSYP